MDRRNRGDPPMTIPAGGHDPKIQGPGPKETEQSAPHQQKATLLGRVLTFFAEQRDAFAQKVDALMDSILDYPEDLEKSEQKREFKKNPEAPIKPKDAERFMKGRGGATDDFSDDESPETSPRFSDSGSSPLSRSSSGTERDDVDLETLSEIFDEMTAESDEKAAMLSRMQDSVKFATGKARLADDLREAVQDLEYEKGRLLSRVEDTVNYAMSKQQEVDTLTGEIKDLKEENGKLIYRVEDAVSYAMEKQKEVDTLSAHVHDLEDRIKMLEEQLRSRPTGVLAGESFAPPPPPPSAFAPPPPPPPPGGIGGRIGGARLLSDDGAIAELDKWVKNEDRKTVLTNLKNNLQPDVPAFQEKRAVDGMKTALRIWANEAKRPPSVDVDTWSDLVQESLKEKTSQALAEYGIPNLAALAENKAIKYRSTFTGEAVQQQGGMVAQLKMRQDIAKLAQGFIEIAKSNEEMKGRLKTAQDADILSEFRKWLTVQQKKPSDSIITEDAWTFGKEVLIQDDTAWSLGKTENANILAPLVKKQIEVIKRSLQ